jgi:hypothetical protein
MLQYYFEYFMRSPVNEEYGSRECIMDKTVVFPIHLKNRDIIHRIR